ncbi:MAG: hypothetical protein IJ728_09720 [Selenomonadaceae bacterium]|nr:hypothetical protein [Selenomonadaceae bacterium]
MAIFLFLKITRGGGGITLQECLSRHAFIVIPTPYYDDKLFEFLHSVGYQWGKDYITFI